MTRTHRWPGRPVALAASAAIGVLLLVALSRAPGDAGTASQPPAASASDATAVATPLPSRRPTPSSSTIGPTVSPSIDATAGPAPQPSVPDASADPATSGDTTAGTPLAGLLARLSVAAEQRAGYDRQLFEHWIDADRDGCNARYEVLIEEAVIAPTVGAGCSLSGGTWFSLYDGLTFNDPGDLDIDHVVALAEAWDSGAFSWSAERRRAYANDLDAPFALIAVSAGSNRSKSDLDPADWLPPSGVARCPFVGAWLAVKVRWDLAIDGREQTALQSLVAGCPATTMLVEPAPTVGTSPTATMAGKMSGPCDPAYPTVCIPPAPPDLDCGEITFRNFAVLAPDPHRFDGDHDGIGCET
jgi:hypothetical protein